jgi:CPA2 family monovalent cation:H+ antiporter-2
MHAETGLETYKDLLLFLATAAIIVPFFKRFHVSPVLGYIAGGAFLGPFGLGALASSFPWLSNITIADVAQISSLGEFGVAFLLFMIGLELSWDRLFRMRRLVFGLGALQVLVSTAILAGVAMTFKHPATLSVIIGGALAMSSTAIVLPSLAERKKLNSGAGRATFAVLLFQDLSVAPLLFMVAMLSGPAASSIGDAAVYVLAPAVMALFAIVLLGRFLLRPLFHMVAAAGNSELFVAASLLVVIGAGMAMAASGQSMSLGAFVAGLLLGETEYRRQIEVTIQPFEGLLLGLFFLSVGARLDFSTVTAAPAQTIGVAASVIVLKAVIILPLGLALGLPRRIAADIALWLAPAGEFALVLIGAAVAGNVITAQAGTVVIMVATLSMLAIPLMMRISDRKPRTETADDPALAHLLPGQREAAQVLVIGYGRVGQLVGEMLARHEIAFIAIDRDPKLVTDWRRRGITIFYGDASRIELLRRCGIASARALVVTLDSAPVIEDVVTAARSERPHLTIVSRARDAKHATKLYQLKVTDAVPETIEASLQLSEVALVDIGVPMGSVIASVHEKREEFRRHFQAVDESGTPTRAVRSSDK